MIETLSGTLGAGDCERLTNGDLIQPANAWSSLTYSAVGIVLVISARQVSGRERNYRIVFGLLLIATGIGSFLYHGPQPPTAGFLHDITFLSTLSFLVLVNAGAALRGHSRIIWGAIGIVLAVLVAVLLAAPTSTNVLTGITVAGLVLSDLALHRVAHFNGRWYTVALVLFAAALAANLLGRSISSTCAPDSVFQFHALWHVLSAGALGAYFLATQAPREQEPSE